MDHLTGSIRMVICLKNVHLKGSKTVFAAISLKNHFEFPKEHLIHFTFCALVPH